VFGVLWYVKHVMYLVGVFLYCNHSLKETVAQFLVPAVLSLLLLLPMLLIAEENI
jgi:hypothetical protein